MKLKNIVNMFALFLIAVLFSANALAGVSITPKEAYTTDNLIAEETNFCPSPNQDGCYFEWIKNDVTIHEGAGQTELPSQNTEKHDRITVKAYLPEVFGMIDNLLGAASVIIRNSIPEISNIRIDISEENYITTYACNFDFADADNDRDRSNVTWFYADGTAFSTSRTITSNDVEAGEEIYCSATAYDGEDYGNTLTTRYDPGLITTFGVELNVAPRLGMEPLDVYIECQAVGGSGDYSYELFLEYLSTNSDVTNIWLTEGESITKEVNGQEHTIEMLDAIKNENISRCELNIDENTRWIDLGQTITVNGMSIEVIDVFVIHSAMGEGKCQLRIISEQSGKHLISTGNQYTLNALMQGEYEISCIATDAVLDINAIARETVIVEEYNESGVFTVQIIYEQNGFTVSFDAETRNSFEPISYSWSFGDNAVSAQESPTHTYAKTGYYLVVLTATDAYGRTAEDREWIRIYDTGSDDESDEDAETAYGKIQIARVNYEEIMVLGSENMIGISVKNTGSNRVRDVKVIVLMLEDGTLSTTAKISEISAGSTASANVALRIPMTTWTGWHTLRIVASNDYAKALTHREVRVVS